MFFIVRPPRPSGTPLLEHKEGIHFQPLKQSHPSSFSRRGRGRSFNRQLRLLRFCSGLYISLMVMTGVMHGQTTRHDFSVVDLPLDEALTLFSEQTGVSVAYFSDVVAEIRTTCQTTNATPENLLRCLLEPTGLTVERLPSGTVVIRNDREPAAPLIRPNGIVVDAQTGMPLAHARLTLLDLGRTVYANEAGLFTFPPLTPGSYIVSATYIGYRSTTDTLHVAAADSARYELRLEPDPVVMEPVVVDGVFGQTTGSGLGQARLEQGQLQTQPSTLGAADVLRSADVLTGIRFDEAGANLHVQSGDAGEHQIRLDGSPVFVTPHLGGLLGPFSPLALKRVTIHKAGFGAAEGSQTSGVVVAEHRLHQQGEEPFELQVDPLSLNAHIGLARPLGSKSRLNLMTAARIGLWPYLQAAPLAPILDQWSRPDLFFVEGPFYLLNAPNRTPPGLADLQPRLDLQFSDVHAALRFRFNRLRSLKASFYRGGHTLHNTLEPTFEDLQRNPSLFLFSINDATTRLNESGQIRFDTVIGSRLLAGIRVRGSRYRLEHDYTLRDSIVYGVNLVVQEVVTEPVRDVNRVREWAIETSFETAAHPSHYLRFGFDLVQTTSRFDIAAANGAILIDDVISDSLVIQRRRIIHDIRSPRFALYVEDRLRLSERVTAELGLRLTALRDSNLLYAENRAAVQYDHPGRLPWSVRAATGLYRQFLNQVDVSSSNMGTLLPLLRFWLPSDGSIAPPKVAHWTLDALLVRPTWRMRLEAYAKAYLHLLALGNVEPRSLDDTTAFARQSDFLESGRGQAFGLSAAIDKQLGAVRLHTRLAWSRTRRRTLTRFDGRWTSVPWNIPLRFDLNATWTLNRNLTLQSRWRSLWGRAMGFRQAYYDYFSVNPETRFFDPFDLNAPNEHILPALHQLDFSLTYAAAWGPVGLRAQVGVLNVLDRTNVADWRLRYDYVQNRFNAAARELVPFTPSASLRLSW